MSIELSIIVAVYNESPKNLLALVSRLCAVLNPMSMSYELIFVNDGSRTTTAECLRQLAKQLHYVKLINLSRNFGQQAAISAGIDYAEGHAIINIDSDLQDPPELIPEMVRQWQSGFDVVYAKRSTRRDRMLKRLTAFLFYRMMSQISSIVIPEDTGDFRLIDRRVAQALKKMPERTRFLRGLIPWLGFRQTAVLVERDAREYGQSSYTWKKLLSLAGDGIMSFSSMPLFMVSVVGAVVIILAFMLALITVSVAKLPVAVTLSLITVVVFFSGIQLIGIGIVAVYLSKMLDEVRDTAHLRGG